MSTAHRPTWTPAQGKETRGNSRQYSARDIAGHTKLKFRQPGQGTKDEIQRRDLRLELERAEKRSKAGGPLTDEPIKPIDAGADDEQAQQVAKRRKILEEAAELDRDDSDDNQHSAGGNGADSGDEDTSASDDEDDEAALMRELQKIRRERAEEKEREERERLESEATDREEFVAMGNPLLNLQAAMNPSAASSSRTESFTVKRRWDDDVIFKNQARGTDQTPKQGVFVNDLLRTEFHRKFLKRFIA